MKYKILIVDDEPANLRMLERLFRADYDVITAGSGTEAIELLGQHDVALIISDQRMPGMTGIEFLKQAAQIRQQTVRIILTGYTDVSDLVEVINSGVIYKYITKPWVNTDLQQTVQRGIEHYEANKGHHMLAYENEHLKNRIEITVQGFVNAVMEMITQKNSKLAEHCRRTSNYASLIGEQFNLKPAEMKKLMFASLLHEVPNMKVPFAMTFAKTALTAEQYRRTRNRYENGLGMISSVPDLEEVATIIGHQHEYYNGAGFFNGLIAENIPFLSRLLAVANAFDEINSGQNPALFCTDEEAADWLRSRAGSEFDPQVVEACLRIKLQEFDYISGVAKANVRRSEMNLCGVLTRETWNPPKTVSTSEIYN